MGEPQRVVTHPCEVAPGAFIWTSLVKGPGVFQLDCQLFGDAKVDKKLRPFIDKINGPVVTLDREATYRLGGGVEVRR